jgi:hypothetical protein
VASAHDTISFAVGFQAIDAARGADARSSIATRANHALLTAIGLLGCEPRSEVVAPIVLEPEGEPAGRVDPPTPDAGSSDIAVVPPSREWCGAIIDTRPRPLLRTSSFLLAWNEVRIADGRAPAGPIPLNEHDARLTICGSPTCEVTVPKPIEFNNAGQISIGTVVPGGPEGMLVIPDLSPFFSPSQCANATEMNSQQVGDLLHVSAVSESTPMHPHHGGAYYGYGCYAAVGRHDVFIDIATGTIELEIEHRGDALGVTAFDQAGLHVTLSGCSTTLELAWTE